MDINEFKNPSGRLVPSSDHRYYSFVPNPLPVEISYDLELAKLLSDANLWLGRLDGSGREISAMLNIDPNQFIRLNLYNEAVASSRIEGTQSTLDDVLKEQAGQGAIDERGRNDLLEVLNYIKAQEMGIEAISKGNKIGIELIKELHSILLHNVRGEKAEPGRIRSVQNYISKFENAPGIEYSTYVPPPPETLETLLDNLLTYMQSSADPAIVKVALMHYQFEAIHPFLDGNGRIGRLLIILYLIRERVLSLPMLYMSDYFEKNRQSYYSLLLNTSKESAYSDWLKFFLAGVIYQARGVIEKIDRLSAYYLEKKSAISRYSKPTSLLFQNLFTSYFVTIAQVSRLLGITYPTAKVAVENLVKEGVLEPSAIGKKRKMFVAKEIRNIYRGEE